VSVGEVSTLQLSNGRGLLTKGRARGGGKKKISPTKEKKYEGANSKSNLDNPQRARRRSFSRRELRHNSPFP